MALLNRLIGVNMTQEEWERGRLPIHECIAAWGEVGRGETTLEYCEAFFELTAEERTSLDDWFIAVGQGAFTLEELEGVLLLGSRGFYTEEQVRIRLGLQDPPAP